MALFGITLRYIWMIVPMAGFLLGNFLDEEETKRMVSYRDKSALYGGRKDADKNPSWPDELFKF